IVDLQKHIDALYANCGAIVELFDRAGVVIFKIYPNDFPTHIAFDKLMLLSDNDKVLIGYDRSMKPIVHSFNTNPHLLIGGISGYGKTDLLRLILYQLLMSH